MTTTTSSPNVSRQQTGFGEWLRSMLRRLFGGSTPSAAPADDNTRQTVAATEADSDYVIAPGGFRIHKPQASTDPNAVSISSLDELVPDVREGLKLLPPLPTIVMELLREIQSTSSTAASVAEIASSDPSLAASLLRAVNSAAFGLPNKVTSVSQAVSLLGFGAVRSLVVRFRLEAMMPARSPECAVASEDLWTHSLAVSYIAAALAGRMQEVDRGFVSTLGLLHDLGRLAIYSQYPNFAAALKNVDPSVDSMLQRETVAFGADHATVGALLGNRWKLPADLNTAIRWHHNPANAFEPSDPVTLRKAAHLVQVADQLAKFCFSYSENMEIDLPGKEAMDMLGLHGSLSQLLDAKVRAAATQAILYADENTSRPLTIVRPFLALRRGEAAAALLADLGSEQSGAGIGEGSAGSDLIDSAEKTYECKGTQPQPAAHSSAGSAKYKAPATAAGADWLVKSLIGHLRFSNVTPQQAGMARAAVRALLPNLLGGQGETIEIAAQWEAPTLHVAIRSASMAFASRLADATQGRRVLEAELANVLNLGWFDAETSPDGATLLLRSR
jgi:putative nucleotidyltransferase with HDIG domain